MKTQLNDLFDQIEPEEGNKLDDKIQVDNLKVQKIYDNCIQYRNYFKFKALHDYVNKKIIRDTKAKDITAFTMKLKENSTYDHISNVYIATYINRLIEFSTDKKHLLIFPETKNDLDKLCSNLEHKEIHIYGYCGTRLGELMKSGKIIANGKVGYFPGNRMKGGKIIIEESCYKEMPGLRMTGGEILVKNLHKHSKIMQNNYEKLTNGYTKITSK